MPMNKIKKSEISTRLQLAREHAGLSQGQVAKLLGVLRPTISEIEAGRRKVKVEELSKFAEIYDVSIEWLLGNKSQEANETTPRLELAARELSKLNKQDLDTILRLLSSLKNEGKTD